MLHSQNEPDPLSDDALRRAILAAIDNEAGARFIYDEKLVAKLQKRAVSLQDVLCVCRSWQWRRSTEWDNSTWRYRIEGENLNGHLMSVVLAVYTNPIVCVAVTGFRCSRGRGKKP